METVTILARAIHFAATLSLVGVFVFLAVVAEPVLARAQLADAAAFRRTLRRVAWASLVVALLVGPTLVGAAWLLSTVAPTSVWVLLLLGGGLIVSAVLIPLTLLGLLAVTAARRHDR